MKRIFALVLALTICLFSAAALAEGKLTVTEKNLIQLDGSDVAYFFAKVENTGDDAIGVGTGSIKYYDTLFRTFIQRNVVDSGTGSRYCQQVFRQIHLMHGSTANQNALCVIHIIGYFIVCCQTIQSHFGNGIQAIDLKHFSPP